MNINIILDKESLGINLKSCLGGYGAYVDHINNENRTDEAHDIRVGDLLKEVNDIDVSLFSVAEVYSVLRQAARPLSIVFWRTTVDGAANDSLSVSQVVSDLRNTSWIKKQLKVIGASTNDFELLAIWSKFSLARHWLEVLLLDSTFESSFRQQSTTLLNEITTEPSLVPYLASYKQEEAESLYDVCVTALRQFLHDMQRSSAFESLVNTFLQSDSHARYQAYFVRQPVFMLVSFSDVLKQPLGLLSFANILSSSRSMWNCKLLNVQHKLKIALAIGDGQEWSRVATEFAVECLNKGYLRSYYESAAYSWFTPYHQHNTTDDGNTRSFSPLPDNIIFSMLPQHYSVHHICPYSKSVSAPLLVDDDGSRVRVKFLVYSHHNPIDNNVAYSYSVHSINYTLSRVSDNSSSSNKSEECESLDLIHNTVEFVQSSSVLRLLCPQLHHAFFNNSGAPATSACTNVIIDSEALKSVLYACSWLTLYDNTPAANKISTSSNHTTNNHSKQANTAEVTSNSSEVTTKISESVLRMASTALIEARRQWNINLPVAAQSFSTLATNITAGANKLLIPVNVSATTAVAAAVITTGAIEDENRSGSESGEETILQIIPAAAIENDQQQLSSIITADSESTQRVKRVAEEVNITTSTVENSPASTSDTSNNALIGECTAVISFTPLLFSLRNKDEEQSSPFVPPIMQTDKKADEFGYDLIPELISPSTFMSLFFAFLLEVPILILSSSVDMTSAIIIMEFLKDAIRPLVWPHINAANVPIDMARELLSCPTPFLIGMQDEVFEDYCRREGGDWDRHDVMIIHLDDDFIQWPGNGYSNNRARSEELNVIKKLSLLSEDNISDLPLLRELYQVMRPAQYRLTNAAQQTISRAEGNSHDSKKNNRLYDEYDHSIFPSQLADQFPWLNIEAVTSKTNTKSEKILVICQSYMQQLLHGWRFSSIVIIDDKAKALCFDEDAFYQLKKHLQRLSTIVNQEVMLLSKHLQSFYRRWLRSQGLSLYLTEQAQHEG